MSDIKRDKLGRRIPEFDRSAAGKKAAKTLKEKHGEDHFRKLNSSADHSGNRGYLGSLKDAGETEKLKEVTQKGVKSRTNHFKKLQTEDPEALRSIGEKGRQKRYGKRRVRDGGHA